MSHLVLFAVMLAGTLLGMLPFLAFLRSPALAAVYLGGALLVAFTATARQVSAKNSPPRVGEGVCAVLGLMEYGAGASIIGFALYGIGFGAVELVGVVDRWLQLSWHLNPSSVAFWVSGPFVVLLSLLALSFTPVPRALFPAYVGIATAYDELSRDGTLLWAVPLAVAAIALSIVVYFLWPDIWWLHVLAILMISTAGRKPMDVANAWSPARVLNSEALEATQKLYRTLGYETVVSPQTTQSNAEVDSLLKSVDILASCDQDAKMIALKTAGQSNAPVSAADASILPIAARALGRYLSDLAKQPVAVHPVLILVGMKATMDLARMAEEQDVRVVTLTEDAVREVVKTDNKDALQQLAHRYLGSDLALSTSVRAGAAS